MKRASERGTRVHKAIENYCIAGEEDGSEELRNYKFLAKHYNFKAIMNEVPIILEKDDRPVCAGRLDLVLNIDGAYAVADIKITATLDKDYLTYQLNIYRLALMQNVDINIAKLYGLHIRENKRKFVEIPINERIAWELIEEYESEERNK
jgi:CRISPR/Cas system-associated exonuclease Cas4 (RecB family)